MKLKTFARRAAAAGAVLAALTLAALPALAAPKVQVSTTNAVADHADILSDETEQYVNDVSIKLSDACGAQIGVYTLDELLGSTTMEGFAYDVFNAWGLGADDLDNGVLLLLAPNEADGGDYYIMRGDGLESQLSFSTLGSLLDEYMEPYWVNGDYDTGTQKTVQALANRLCSIYGVTLNNGYTDTSAPDRGGPNVMGFVLLVVAVLLVIAYVCVKDKKTSMGFERSMADGEILRRLFGYAKPYLKQFVVVGFLVLFSISYDIASPLIVGYIEELVVGDFELKSLYVSVAVYAGVLVFSMASTYLQAVILQRVGQRIISDLREDLFTHIESLSHGQLNDIPVGKLVTRVTNDTNAISMMFTNLFVNLTKNAFVILGILVAMLCLNYALTLMVLCFVPFIVIFTVIFRKFSRRAYRKVKDATTDINTYLSENLSGIKVTQIFGREDEKMAEFYQKANPITR